MGEITVLRVVCADLPAPPLFWRDEAGNRFGYETEVAKEIARRLERNCRFIYVNWINFYPTINAGDADIVLCGQGISEYRMTLVDFSEPYAIFDEAVMCLKGSSLRAPGDLVGKRVGAIANSVNMALAETFPGVTTVSFKGTTKDVMGEMVESLRKGEIDAFVDDDVALIPLAEEADLEIAFTHPSRNEWGCAIKKGNKKLKKEIDVALASMKQDGTLKEIWEREIKFLPYPF